MTLEVHALFALAECNDSCYDWPEQLQTDTELALHNDYTGQHYQCIFVHTFIALIV